ncbi:Protein of unknown function [Hymenobacter daecheongensis DSM 21074]|uniref:DUF2867 domain-containing protein n=1 Tax=Hymenobacter daecheongensis DSM 21074 TaxID=1121955 RepID=A0A1M6KRP3_9BACT|nr:DUF2867 domain-containing protein [Hymenobacter daecheongensis]SHJ61629.1 Protein of unknown function [Hymenobacter daecheongensis DSM 21074]
MNQPLIVAVGVPADSRLSQYFPEERYADAYAVPLAAHHPAQAPAVARLLLGQGPNWVRRLLRLRDWLVRPLGLATFPTQAAPAPEPPLVAGGQLGPFRVFSVEPQEVVLGQDDHHLDFRVSVWVPAGAEPRRAVLSTAVRFHNRLGRVYFALIRPFHHLVVKALLRHALRAAPAA